MFKVLIVEDHAFFRESLVRLVRSKFRHIAVSEAADGGTVLPKVENDRSDLIFMDIGLPGVNGITLTRKIKQSFPHITIAVLTNYDSPEYEEGAFQSGADYFLPKNSTGPGELTTLVETVMEKKERQTTAENKDFDR